MQLKEAIKGKLCSPPSSADFPLENLVEWIELQSNQQVLRYLEEIQQELCSDEQVWSEASAHGNVTKQQAQVRLWREQCAKLSDYYRAVTDNPRGTKVLEHFAATQK